MADAPPIAAEQERAKSKRIGALAALWPFLRPYRRMLAAATAALTATAIVSLILPLAARRVVDNFETADSLLLDRYFLSALGIAGLLAAGSALRYYLVTRLGERVVADIRKAVFDRMIGMSPAFYEKIMTGEVLSRITTDTTLVLSVIGSSVSIALRNLLTLVGGLVLLLITSAKLTGLVLLIVPAVIVPIVVLGRRLRRLSRENQDWIASSSGSASEALLAAQTVQAFSHEGPSRARFATVTEKSFDSARNRIGVRAAMTAIVIFLIFSGVVGVLWIGAHDVRAGTMSVGELVQFVIYAVIVAGGVGALTEVWGELQRAAGATERLVELLAAGAEGMVTAATLGRYLGEARAKAPVAEEDPALTESQYRKAVAQGLSAAVDAMEDAAIARCLAENGGKKTKALKTLKISTRMLYASLERTGKKSP